MKKIVFIMLLLGLCSCSQTNNDKYVKVTDKLLDLGCYAIKVDFVEEDFNSATYKVKINDGFGIYDIGLQIEQNIYKDFFFSPINIDAIGKKMINDFESQIEGQNIDTAISDITSSSTSFSTIPTLKGIIDGCKEHYINLTNGIGFEYVEYNESSNSEIDSSLVNSSNDNV